MWFDFMLTSQRYRVTLQLLDTEQLRAQQLRIPVITQRIPCAPRNKDVFNAYEFLLSSTWSEQRDTGPMNSVRVRLISRVFRPFDQLFSEVVIQYSGYSRAESLDPRCA